MQACTVAPGAAELRLRRRTNQAVHRQVVSVMVCRQGVDDRQLAAGVGLKYERTKRVVA